MSAPRNEIRTGLFVVLSLALLVAVLFYIGIPGVFTRLNHYYIYFENAGGIKPGADVMVAGRKAGQVERVFSPIPENARPEPKYESLVEVQVAASASIYNNVRAQLVQPTLLGDMMVDFSGGRESSGLAPDGAHFLGEKVPGLNDVAPQVIEQLKPVLAKASAALDGLKKTSDNLAQMTAEDSDLRLALGEFRIFGIHLNELSGPNGPLTISLENIEKITSDLAANKDIELTLRNTRQAAEKLNSTVGDLSPRVSTIGHNLEQATDTVKHQPWRLIWPTTKKYKDDASPAPSSWQSNAAPARTH